MIAMDEMRNIDTGQATVPRARKEKRNVEKRNNAGWLDDCEKEQGTKNAGNIANFVGDG